VGNYQVKITRNPVLSKDLPSRLPINLGKPGVAGFSCWRCLFKQALAPLPKVCEGLWKRVSCSQQNVLTFRGSWLRSPTTAGEEQQLVLLLTPARQSPASSGLKTLLRELSSFSTSTVSGAEGVQLTYIQLWGLSPLSTHGNFLFHTQMSQSPHQPSPTLQQFQKETKSQSDDCGLGPLFLPFNTLKM
jgi:hypothetical protein